MTWDGNERRGDSIYERVAVLESKVGSIDDILKELKCIRSELTRYKGFIGGVIFVVSGAFTLVVLAREWFMGK